MDDSRGLNGLRSEHTNVTTPVHLRRSPALRAHVHTFARFVQVHPPLCMPNLLNNLRVTTTTTTTITKENNNNIIIIYDNNNDNNTNNDNANNINTDNTNYTISHMTIIDDMNDHTC